MLQTLLRRFGIYYSKRQYMPYGIDWLWDLARLEPRVSVRTVIDVGANEGQTVSAVASAFPGAMVHAFEPIATTFDVLQRSFGADPNVRVNRLAVSSAAGTALMRSASYSPASHIVLDQAGAGDRLVSVETVTLDAYCGQHAIAHIDILKTDTEGHDLEVLKGARRLFTEARVDWVLTEATFDPDDASHSDFGSIHEWLAGQGMTPWCFYEQFHIDGGRRLMFLNVLFARRLPAAPKPS
jgi:FkbM family methyltransferase